MSPAHSKSIFRRGAAIAATTLALAACATPADLEPDPIESEKIDAQSAIAYALGLAGQVNPAVALASSAAFGLADLVRPADNAVTLSVESLEAIADIVDDALTARFLTANRGSMRAMLTDSGDYFRRECVQTGDCSAAQIRTMRNDAGDILDRAIDVYSSIVTHRDDTRLQLGTPLITAGSMRLFALNELALMEALDGSAADVERAADLIEEAAEQLIEDLDDLEDLYARYIESRYGEITCRRQGRADRCTWATPFGQGITSRGRGTAERMRTLSMNNTYTRVFGPRADYELFRNRVYGLSQGVEYAPLPIDDLCANRLDAGQSLGRGTRTSCNERFELRHYGAIVETTRDGAGRPVEGTIWRPNVSGNRTLSLTAGGELRITAGRQGVRWRTPVTAGAGAYALLHDDGDLVLYRRDETPVWSSRRGALIEVAPPPANDVRFGRRIALRGAHGRYFVAERDGRANANRGRIGPWERFIVGDAGGSAPNRALTWGATISLRSAHGRYVVAERDGALNANRQRVGPYERFTVLDPSNTRRASGAVPCGATIALRSTHGRYVVAESDGAANANRARIGSWERIRLVCQ